MRRAEKGSGCMSLLMIGSIPQACVCISAPRFFGHPVQQRCTADAAAAHRPSTRNSVAVRAGFFDFLSSNKKASPDGEKLASELLQVSRGGAKGEIRELVQQLQSFKPRSASSPLLWATWEVVYASAPSAVGGALVGALGLGKTQTTLFEKPDLIVNKVTFKTLGLLPGSVTQAGRFEVAGNIIRAQLREPNVSVVGDAAVDTKGDIIADVQFEVLYLGEEAAVLQLVPADDEDDEEAAEQPLFVLRNTGAQSLPSAEAEDSDEEAPEDTSAQAQGSRQRGRRSAKQAERAVTPDNPEAARKQELQANIDRLETAYRQAQSESKEAAAELRSTEKEAQSAGRQVRPAQGDLERAEKRLADISQQAEQASQTQQSAEERVRSAVASLREKEAAASK